MVKTPRFRGEGGSIQRLCPERVDGEPKKNYSIRIFEVKRFVELFAEDDYL
jgi:hypothetical protein